ncbi:MAG: hypothetical protein PHS68_06400 [Candidatus Izemoplasmatales bacterium]|nr:hypothetical protein [Candidatus Izemoplasmatales bacterium]
MQDNLTEKQKEYIERIERNTKGLTAISTGICPGCEKCLDDFGIRIECECGGDDDCELCNGFGKRKPTEEEFEDQCSNEDAYDEGCFSWSSCDLCGCPLGGSRVVWHGVDKDGNIVHGDHACVDCMMYLANGEVPDDEYL